MTRDVVRLKAELESVEGTASCLRSAADQLESMSVRLLSDAKGLRDRLEKLERMLARLDGDFGAD